jgi:ABC-type antimicrobial peptide transport system permease subunit
MTTVWLRLRADVRQRWRALLSLALLLGLVGAVVLTAAAGARRTDTAYPRLLAWANASQLDIIPQGTGMNGFYPALARLKQVESMAVAGLYQAALPGTRDRPVQLISTPDGKWGGTVDRVKILAGHRYNPMAAGEAMIDPRLAAVEHLAPGDTLTLTGVPSNQVTGVPDFARSFSLSFTVTAIVAFDNQIVATGSEDSNPTALVSAPFFRSQQAAGAHTLSFGDEAAVRLRPGTRAADLIAGANALAKHFAGTLGGVDAVNFADQVTATQRAIAPQAVALAAFAVLAALIGLAVLSQLLGRQLVLDAAEYPVLRALGATRGVLVCLTIARLAVITVGGAVIAAGLAVAASPLMPIGPARLAEPTPGAVDLGLLAGGAAAIVLLPLLVLVRAAWRAGSAAGGPLGVAEPSGPARQSRLGALLGRAGAICGAVGVRMAFEPGRGRTAVPVRSALVGSVIAVAAVVAAGIFGASLIGLVSTPSAYGQNWDDITDLGFGGVTAGMAHKLFATDPSVTQYAAGDYGQVAIGGRAVAAIGLDQPTSAATDPRAGYLTMLAGRAPFRDNEIALGAQTMSALGLRVGQYVAVTPVHLSTKTPDRPRPMRIVGEVVLPAFSRGSFAPTGLGTGAVVTASLLSEPQRNTGCDGPRCYNFFLLRFRPGTDIAAHAAKITQILEASGCPIGSCITSHDQRPGDIRNYTAIRDTPLALGTLLAALAVATLAHVLLTGVRRRRRDLAVLKTLGFTRSQVLRAVAWEASAFAAVALLVGMPLGVVAGRQAWSFFAASAGVSTQPAMPLALVLLAVPVTLTLSNLIAAAPGWRAARIRPAAVLRAE